MKKTTLIAIAIALFLPIFVLAQSPSNNRGVASKPAFPNKENPYQFTMEVKPGESITETIAITNQSEMEGSITIKGVDSGKNEKNENYFKLSSEEQNEVGAWIVPSQENITLEPKQSANSDFTVIVPKDTPLGEYLGGLSIETASIGTMKDKNGGNVQINLRKVETIKIKVTDDPQPIEKMPPPPLPWMQIYFGASLGLFIIVIVYLFISRLKKGKKGAKK